MTNFKFYKNKYGAKANKKKTIWEKWINTTETT